MNENQSLPELSVSSSPASQEDDEASVTDSWAHHSECVLVWLHLLVRVVGFFKLCFQTFNCSLTQQPRSPMAAFSHFFRNLFKRRGVLNKSLLTFVQKYHPKCLLGLSSVKL